MEGVRSLLCRFHRYRAENIRILSIKCTFIDLKIPVCLFAIQIAIRKKNEGELEGLGSVSEKIPKSRLRRDQRERKREKEGKGRQGAETLKEEEEEPEETEEE